MISREFVLSVLGEHKPGWAAKYGVTRLGIFGSLARGEWTDASDVDVVVHMPPDLFLMVHLKEELEQELHTPVDLIRYQPHLNTSFKNRIDREAVYV